MKGLAASRALDAVDPVNDKYVVIHTKAVCALAPFSAAGRDGHARAQLEQAHEIAPVQGHLIDLLVGERSAQDRAGRVHQWGLFRDRHRLLRVTGLENKVDADVAGDLQLDIPSLDILKAWGRGADHIDARKQVRNQVLSRFIRSKIARQSSLCIGDGHGRAHHHGLGLVENAPQNASGIGLRAQRNASQNNCQRPSRGHN